MTNLDNKKIIFSGIQPTGNIHIGNYLGSIANWSDLLQKQDVDCESIFGIMNLHAITVSQDPNVLRQNILDATAVYLACGLDPKKATIFVQSEISEHAELAWILGTLTPMSWLNRMTQFKDKSASNNLKIKNNLQKEIESNIQITNTTQGGKINLGYQVSSAKQLSDYHSMLALHEKRIKNEEGDVNFLGLYSYPVLMAADILLYKANLVPVGEDQKQHLELTRDLAGAFNRRYKTEYFKLPEPLIIENVKRIMSLQDGTKKMSKSDESEISRINIEDSPEVVIKKIKKAKTDSENLIEYNKNRPEIYNLINIFSAFSKKNPSEIVVSYKNLSYGTFKSDLADLIIERLKPIQKEIFQLKQDKKFIIDILKNGKEKASIIAAKTLQDIHSIIGFNHD